MNNYPYEQSKKPSGYPYPSYAPQNAPGQPRSYETPPVVPQPASPYRSMQNTPQTQEHPMSGFKPLSREERQEAARIKAQEGFSWAGYQVIHKELFSHKYDPTLTIKDNSISFNNACISRLDQVIYVQLLINPAQQKLVIRPCKQDARDAIRWCITKGENRKSRQITCKLFAAKLYDLMGWESMYRYKLQGSKIDYEGEELYVFDLSSTEIWLPQVKETDENGVVRHKPRQPLYPISWRDSFGLPVEEHSKSTQVNLNEDFTVEDISATEPGGIIEENITFTEVSENV